MLPYGEGEGEGWGSAAGARNRGGSPTADDVHDGDMPRSIRATSPLRPKARRALMQGQLGPANEAPRRSPMAFQPISRDHRGHDGRGLPHDSADREDSDALALPVSMAGLMNPQELRRAAAAGALACEPEQMIKACIKVFVTQVTPSYSVPWSRGEEARSTGSGFGVLLPPLTRHRLCRRRAHRPPTAQVLGVRGGHLSHALHP